MLVSYNWLQSYLPKLPPPNTLAEMMMLHGLDVESIAHQAQHFNQVVVGQIVGIKPHPNADKLRLADVIIKPNGQPQEIVCGAPNIAVGQKVPVALLGAKLANGLTIESRAIRGVTSNGMLCASDELGLGSDHSGILILDPGVSVGAPFADTLSTSDAVFDVTTPANRADLMSMRGLAWEIGAILGQRPKFPAMKMKESSTLASKSVTVKSASSNLCPLFTVRVIRDVTIQPTPKFIVSRLQAAGMRSVNGIVDIANYIMLEYGQPLHAYDAQKITGSTLTARSAKVGERIVTLDNRARSLTPETLIIADDNGPVGIAGVMGGRDSEVSASTTDVILEAAIFNPVSVRKTSRRFGLVSEASKRFEKGLWPEVTLAALNAAAAMIIEYCGGTIEHGIVKAGKATSAKRTVKLAPTMIAERLGMKISTITSKKTLLQLGFTVGGTPKQWMVTVPSWRLDVSLPEDIVDEIGRMVGYDHVPNVTSSSSVTTNDLPRAIRFQEEVKNILVDMGFTEVISHAFYSDRDAVKVKGDHFEIANPLDVTQQKLRKSLIPEMYNTLKHQADDGKDAYIFEIGLVFKPEMVGLVERQQFWKIAFGVTRKGHAALPPIIQDFQKSLATTIQPESHFVIEELTRGRRIELCEFDLKALMVNAKKVFSLWDPKRHVQEKVHAQELSKFPAITRDISFWWPKDESTICTVIDSLRLPLLREYSVKDTFSKDRKISYAFSFVYQAPDRTLTKDEIDKLEQKIKDALVNNGATIR